MMELVNIQLILCTDIHNADMSVEGFTAGDGSTWDGLDGSSVAIRLLQNGSSWLL